MLWRRATSGKTQWSQLASACCQAAQQLRLRDVNLQQAGPKINNRNHNDSHKTRTKARRLARHPHALQGPKAHKLQGKLALSPGIHWCTRTARGVIAAGNEQATGGTQRSPLTPALLQSRQGPGSLGQATTMVHLKQDISQHGSCTSSRNLVSTHRHC